jgi:hypothetical protein
LLYFSSLRDKSHTDAAGVGFNKLYTAKKSAKKQNKFLRAKELDSLFNKSAIHNANTSFNSDFTKVFVSRCGALNASQYRCEIYVSDFKNGHWTELQKLPSPINVSGSNTTQPCLSEINGKQVLFFSSDRTAGEGAMDLWYALMEHLEPLSTREKKLIQLKMISHLGSLKKTKHYTSVALGIKA